MQRLCLLLACASFAIGANVVPCDLGLLLTLHRQVEPVVLDIAEIHYRFTSGRHHEVIEVISLFQVDRICRSVLKVVESIRQTLGSLVCPYHFDDGVPRDSLPERLTPSRILQQFFADVRQLARTGGTEVYSQEMIDEVSSSWAPSENELLALVLRLENWAVESRKVGYLMEAETFHSIEGLVQRFLAMAVDFARSLAEDMSAMFRAPNYVSREMTPGGQGDTEEHRKGDPVTVDIFQHQPEHGLTLKPEFLSMLRDMPAPIHQPPLHKDFKVCESLPPILTSASVPQGLSLDFLDEAGGWSHRDVTGAQRRSPSPLQLLQAVASSGTRLSNLFISVQVSPYLLTPSPSCGSKQTLYDPSHCLVERQFAGYFFHLNPLPPFNVSVVYSGRPLGPHGQLPSFEVHQVHVPNMETQWNSLVVVNFMHYFLLYCRLHQLNPRRTRMLSALIEKNFKWYQQCLMLDIEVVRLDWFRSETYQDFFRYMDSVGGFWLHRWGNNPLRTFAVALLLRDEDVRSVVMPYAHQDFCSCGPGGQSCTWLKEKQEYTCQDVTPEEFRLEELAEGLLDLQPWRGSARQLSRQAEMDVYRFAAGLQG